MFISFLMIWCNKLTFSCAYWFNSWLYHYAFRWISCKEINPESLVRAKENAIETVCLFKEGFPMSILTIQVHLLVHLVNKVEIAGIVLAGWMFFLERFMKNLKGFVRQQAWPEAPWLKDGWYKSHVFLPQTTSHAPKRTTQSCGAQQTMIDCSMMFLKAMA